MKYLVLGAKGQLGLEFCESLGEKSIGVGKEECDISNLDQVMDVVSSVKPGVVINCAAYNLVDDAERMYCDAFKVNALGVRNLAYACKKVGAFLVHFSTDYVFDGTKVGMYTESDEPNPLNMYGKSKLLGEQLLREELSTRYLLFRVSWVYGRGKRNFVYKVLNWAKNKGVLKVACDEFSAPTSTRTIVRYSLKALKVGLEGLYHLVNTGFASRYEWARRILAIFGLKKFIYPVHRSEFSLPASRPYFSAMDNSLISKELGVQICCWEEELEEFYKCIGSPL